MSRYAASFLLSFALRLAAVLALPAFLLPPAAAAEPDPPATAAPAWLPPFLATPESAPQPLAYSPTVWYSSYFGGGNGETLIRAIKVSASGEIHIAGTTTSTNLPTTPGMGQNYAGGGSDGFIAKFAPDMRSLVYLQYIGSPLYDEVNALALDAAGNAYLAGYVYQSLSLRKGDALIAKVIYSGGSVTYGSDLIGGPNTGIDYAGDDEATDVAIQSDGTVVLAGRTTSTSFPGAAGSLGGSGDGFIVLYDGNLQRIRSRYLHAANLDQIRAIDIGADNFITAVGTTDANSLNVHAWAVRLNPAATSIVWNRTYSGNSDDEANDVRVAGAQAYIAGRTNSTDFIAGTPIDPVMNGVNDGFLMRVSTATGLPDYSTYVGGPGADRVRSVDVAENGDVLLCGITQTDPGNNDTTQIFLLRLSGAGLNALDYTVQFGDPADADGIDTFLGRGDSLAMTRAANKAIYVAGLTAGQNFQPIAGQAYQPVKPNVFNAGFYMQFTNDEDFSARFRMTAAAVNVSEGAGSVTLTVERILNTLNTDTVQYASANGTAQAPGDYAARSGTLTFAPGVATQTIVVPLVNDTLDEDGENFSVTLSSPSSGATLGALVTTTVTVADDDATPTLSLQPCQVNEGNSGQVQCGFLARLSAVSGKTVTLRSTTANGSGNAAVAPGDYIAHTNVIRTIPAGTQQITINVPVIGDTAVEPDENFRLTFDQPVNAVAGTSTATGTIVNDDSAPLTNDAAFVSQTVPGLMIAGQTYAVSIVLRNSGSSSWATATHRLGSQNPQNNTTWDADGRIALPAGVAPGANVTFTFQVTAPATPGSYNFQWRMLQDTAAWFGATTPNVAVNVIPDRLFQSSFSAP